MVFSKGVAYDKVNTSEPVQAGMHSGANPYYKHKTLSYSWLQLSFRG